MSVCSENNVQATFAAANYERAMFRILLAKLTYRSLKEWFPGLRIQNLDGDVKAIQLLEGRRSSGICRSIVEDAVEEEEED